MATSLEAQLRKLSTPYTQSLLTTGKDTKRDSLLFDPKEAASLDKEAVFALGSNGLSKLATLNSLFEEYELSLFDPTSVTFERSIQKSDVNKKLNATIHQFLVLLSPYFHLRAAHEAMEWLIYRYHIQMFNVDDVMLCILAYCDSPVFVRMIQLLPLHDSAHTRQWGWLLPMQKAGSPLPLLSIANHCVSEPSFLQFICSLPKHFIKVHGTDNSTLESSPLRSAFSLYSSAICGAMSSRRPSPAFLATLSPHLVAGLRSPALAYHSATYLIITHLFSLSDLDTEYASKLVKAVVRSLGFLSSSLRREGLTGRREEELVFPGLCCVVYAYQTQDIESLDKKSFKRLCQLPGLQEYIHNLHSGRALTRFLPHLFNRLVPSALKSALSASRGLDAMVTSSGSEGEDEGGLVLDSNQLFTDILYSLQLHSKEVTLVTELVLQSYSNLKEQIQASKDVETDFHDKVKLIVRHLENRYPCEFERVLSQKIAAADDSETGADSTDVIRQIASLSLQSSMPLLTEGESAEDKSLSHLTLPLALNHPNPSFRCLATQQIVQSLIDSESSDDGDVDRAFLSRSLLARLHDDDHEVVNTIMVSKLEVLAKWVSPTDAVAVAGKMLDKYEEPEWRDNAQTCLALALQVCSSDESNRERVLSLVLPYLLLFTEHEQGLLDVCLKSEVVAKDNILNGLISGRTGYAKKSCAEWNTRVIELLTKKLVKATTENLAIYLKALSSSSKTSSLLMLLALCSSILQQKTVDISLTYSLIGQILDTAEATAAYRTSKRGKKKRGGPSKDGADNNGDSDNEDVGSYSPCDMWRKVTEREGAINENVIVYHVGLSVQALGKHSSETSQSHAWSLTSTGTSESGRTFQTWLHLLTRMFALLTSRCAQQSQYKKLLSVFMVKALGGSTAVAQFLSMVWSADSAVLATVLGESVGTAPAVAGRPEEGKSAEILSVLLRLRALKVHDRLVSTCELDSLTKSTPAICSLLATLNSTDDSLRSAGLACVISLVNRCGVTQSADQSEEDSVTFPLLPLLRLAVKRQTEIAGDHLHLKEVMRTYFEKVEDWELSPPSPKKRKQDKKSKPNSSNSQQEALQCLLQVVVSRSEPASIRLALLDALSLTECERLLRIALLPLLKEAVKPPCGSTLTSDADDLQIAGHDPETICLLDLYSLALDRVNTSSVSIIDENKDSFMVFLSLLSLSCPVLVPALRRVTGALYGSLGEESQRCLLRTLYDLQTDSSDQETLTTVASVLKHLKIDAQHIISELAAHPVLKDVGSEKRTVRQRKSTALRSSAHAGPRVPVPTETREWRRTVGILEGLQRKKRIGQPRLLLTPLFSLLTRSLSLEESEEGEYLKHLLLTCLASVCEKLLAERTKREGEETKEDNDSDLEIDMEAVVEVIRQSSSVHTHRLALLLLSSVARISPSLVLDNLMPIFTFMGANIMRHDDRYSFSVIGQTLDTIIPILVQASDGTSVIIHDVLRVFATSFTFVPDHRRLPLYTHLVRALGELTQLSPLLLTFCRQEVGGAYRKEEAALTEAVGLTADDALLGKAQTPVTFPFLLKLVSEFSPKTILVAVRTMADHVLALCDIPTKQTVRAGAKGGKRAAGRASTAARSTGALIGQEERAMSDTERRHFLYNVCSLAGKMLTVDVLTNSISGDEATAALLPFESVFQSSLNLVTKANQMADVHSADPSSKFGRAFLHKAHGLLDKLTSLLPSTLFLRVIGSLLSHPIPTIQRKAMDLLCNRLLLLRKSAAEFTPEETSAVLSLIPRLTDLALSEKITTSADKSPARSSKEGGADDISGAVRAEDVLALQQVALYSIKLLARLFAFTHPPAFDKLLDQLTGCLETVSHHALRSSLFLCLAELSCALKVKAISYLPKVMPHILKPMKPADGAKGSTILWQSAAAALQKLVESVPHFMASFMVDILSAVVHSPLSGGGKDKVGGEGGGKGSIAHRLTALREKISMVVVTRTFLPSAIQCYKDIGSNEDCTGPLLKMVLSHVNMMKREELSKHLSPVCDLIFLALNHREKHCAEDSLSSIEEVEDITFDVTVAVVLKLSETAFRPIFFKMCDWAYQQEGITSSSRLLTFYRLSLRLVGVLKGLFTSFMGHSLQNAAGILADVTAGGEGHTVSHLLHTTLLDYLQKCFLYGANEDEELIDKARFDLLTPALVNLIDQGSSTRDDDDDVYIREHLLPCLGQYSIAVGSDSFRKQLNYQICLKSRSRVAKIRKWSLLAIGELARRQGEDYSSLIPETVQFLAELLEDDHEDVGKLCQSTITSVEGIIGESLQKFF